jgi:uncharacterized protein YecT (DUF1311 family)
MWYCKGSKRYTVGRRSAIARPYGFACTPVLMVLSMALPTFAVADETIVPPDWQPSLSEVVANCKAELEPKNGHAPSQRELNDMSSRLAEIYDAELFVTYIRLLDTLDSKQRQKLFHEQKQWLHDRATKAAGQMQSKGGSLEPLEYSSAFSDLTEKRIAELRSRMPPRSPKN